MKYFGLTISLRVATPLRVYSGGFRGGRAGRAPPPPPPPKIRKAYMLYNVN
jgi:hypothetical protein